MSVVSRASPKTLRAHSRVRGLVSSWSTALVPLLARIGLLLTALVLTLCVAFAPTLTLLGLGLGAIAMLAVRAPPFAMVAAIFLYGIEGAIKVRLGLELPGLAISPNALGAALIDLAFVIAFAGLVRSDRGRSLVAIWRNAGRGARIGLLLIVAWLILSVLQTPLSGDLRSGISGFRLTQVYVLAVYAGATLFHRRYTDRLLVALLGVFLVVSAYAAYRAVEGPSTSERVAAFSRQTTPLVPADTHVLFRNVGSFASANGLVSFLVPAAVFGVAIGLLLRPPRLAAWLVAAFAAVALVGAHIRTGFVAFALCSVGTGALVVFASGVARRKKIVLVTVMAVALIGFGVVASSLSAGGSREPHGRAAGLLNPLADPSMQKRFESWRQSLEVVKAHPLGTGLGTVGRATVGQQGSITVTDSSYLKILREQGSLGGLLFFLGVLITGVATAVKTVRAGIRARPIGFAALVASLSFFVLALDSEAIEQPGKVLAWVFLGVALRGAYGETGPGGAPAEGEAHAA